MLLHLRLHWLCFFYLATRPLIKSFLYAAMPDPKQGKDPDHTEASRPLSPAPVPAALFAVSSSSSQSVPGDPRNYAPTLPPQEASSQKDSHPHIPGHDLRARISRTPPPRPHPCSRHPLPPLHLAQHHHPPPRRPPLHPPLRYSRNRTRQRPSRHRPHPAGQALQKAHLPAARRSLSSPRLL